MRNVIFSVLLFILCFGLPVVVISELSQKPAAAAVTPAPVQVAANAAPPQPLFAVMLSQCGGTLGLYVVIDAKHTVLFRPGETVAYTVEDGKEAPTEKRGPVVPINDALELANQARIKQHLVAACPTEGV